MCNVDGNGNGIKWGWVGPLVYLIFSGPRKFSAASKKPPNIILFLAAKKAAENSIIFGGHEKAAENYIIFGGL